MVCFVWTWSNVLPLKNNYLRDPDWLLKIFHQSPKWVLKGNTDNKAKRATWKRIENWDRKGLQIVSAILFDLFRGVTSSGCIFVCIFLVITSSIRGLKSRAMGGSMEFLRGNPRGIPRIVMSIVFLLTDGISLCQWIEGIPSTVLKLLFYVVCDL